MHTPTPTEWIDLINEDNHVIGRAPRAQVRAKNLLHRGVGIICYNSQGDVYVHRRTDTKDVFPGMYDMFVGGVVASKESYSAAATREICEELGIEGPEPAFLFRHLYRGPLNYSWVQVYSVTWDGPITHQPEEIAWGQWLPAQRLDAWAREHEIVPDGLEIFVELRKWQAGQRPADIALP